MLLLGWLACHRPDPPQADDGAPTSTGDTAPPEGTTGDTALTVPPGACAVDPANGLRAWCQLREGASASARVELTLDGDARTRTFVADPALGERVFLWGMKPGRTYTWRMVDGEREESGTFVTGSLPPDLLTFEVRVSATAAAEVEAILFAPSCPGGIPVVVDRDGDVIWWEDLRENGAAIVLNGISYTEDGTVLLDATRYEVREIDLAGNVRASFARGVEFPDYVHHDLVKKDGLVYALRARAGQLDGATAVVDGVYVFDADGALLDELDTEGLWSPVVQPWMAEGYWGGLFPGALDPTHANSIVVDEAGDLIVSFRHLYAFAKFRGGPGTATFGELVWTAVGGADSPISADQEFVLTGGVDPEFQGQHDVNFAPDGTLLLLDNGYQTPQTTRAVRYALDEEGRVLTALEAWDTGLVCPILGGARSLPGGHVVATCDSAGQVFEFAPGSPSPVWQATAICESIIPSLVPRAIPIPLY